MINTRVWVSKDGVEKNANKKDGDEKDGEIECCVRMTCLKKIRWSGLWLMCEGSGKMDEKTDN